MVDVLIEADRLVGSGRVAAAKSLLEKAARDGQQDAAFRLAMWYLVGQQVPRDLPLALDHFRLAAELGHADAAFTEIALTANGAANPADWTRARSLLRELAKSHSLAAAQENILAKMAIDEHGRPSVVPTAERVGRAPDIARFPTLLTPEECREIAAVAEDLLEPALVIDPANGRSIANPIRTSHGAVIGPVRENLVVRAINLRIAAVSATHVDQGEALSVLRYAPGQQFRPHVDAVPNTNNQRVLTVLIYLNDDFQGGETIFTANGVSITPRQGDAIVFSNVLASGSPDPRSQHAGKPVTSGTKWLATRWIRKRSFSPWRGPEIPLAHDQTRA